MGAGLAGRPPCLPQSGLYGCWVSWEQAWGRLQIDDYDYDYDYKQFLKGDYDYDYDYTKLEVADYDYDYDYSTIRVS